MLKPEVLAGSLDRGGTGINHSLGVMHRVFSIKDRLKARQKREIVQRVLFDAAADLDFTFYWGW